MHVLRLAKFSWLRSTKLIATTIIYSSQRPFLIMHTAYSIHHTAYSIPILLFPCAVVVVALWKHQEAL